MLKYNTLLVATGAKTASYLGNAGLTKWFYPFMMDLLLLKKQGNRVWLKGTSINSEPPKGTEMKTITYGAIIDHLWY
jgi:hypothetical protein